MSKCTHKNSINRNTIVGSDPHESYRGDRCAKCGKTWVYADGQEAPAEDSENT